MPHSQSLIQYPHEIPSTKGNCARTPLPHHLLCQGPVPMCAHWVNSTGARQSGNGSWGAVVPQAVLQSVVLEALYLHLLEARGALPLPTPISTKLFYLSLSPVTPSAPLPSVPISVIMDSNHCLLRSPSCALGRGSYCSLHILQASHTLPRLNVFSTETDIAHSSPY